MVALSDLIRTYFSAWNEADARLRLPLLKQCWAADGELIDPFDEQPAVGPEQISELIAKARRERLPAGSGFVLRSEVDLQHQVFRYCWGLVDQQGNELREGLDAGRLASDGRLALILTFLGTQPPAEAAQSTRLPR